MTDATAVLYTVTFKYDYAIIYCHLFLNCWKLILGEVVSKHAPCFETSSGG